MDDRQKFVEQIQQDIENSRKVRLWQDSINMLDTVSESIFSRSAHFILEILQNAVGASAIGCGWYNNLRQFSFDRFEPAHGGQQARPRYSSLQLLNSILVEELDSIHYIGQLASVLSGNTYDNAFSNQQTPSNTPWPLDISTLHHWSVLQHATDRVRSGTSISQCLDISSNMIGQAEAMYQQLMRSGVTFETPSSNRNLLNWRTALLNFRNRVQI